MKHAKLLIVCLFVSVSTTYATHRLTPNQYEPKIRTTITKRAEQLMIDTFSQPPASLGNISTIHHLLSHFDALQANHLTKEYQATVSAIVQEAIKDQRDLRYMEHLTNRQFLKNMHRQTDKGLKKFLKKAQGDLEEIRETGKAVIEPFSEIKLPRTMSMKKKIAELENIVKIRRMIETRGEIIMINALRAEPTSLGNVETIDNILSHFNALQAYKLTNEYRTIIESLIQHALAKYRRQYFDDDAFQTIIHLKVDKELELFTQKAVQTLEQIRETGRATL